MAELLVGEYLASLDGCVESCFEIVPRPVADSVRAEIAKEISRRTCSDSNEAAESRTTKARARRMAPAIRKA